MKKMAANKVMNGTFGRLWVNGELFSNVKSFEAKTTLNWEEISIQGELGTFQKYTGFSGAGTITMHKIDSTIASLMVNAIKSGDMPEIKMIGKLSDPAAYGSERVEFFGVTFDEITLLKFENKSVMEEEVPFKYSGFNFIDKV